MFQVFHHFEMEQPNQTFIFLSLDLRLTVHPLGKMGGSNTEAVIALTVCGLYFYWIHCIVFHLC